MLGVLLVAEIDAAVAPDPAATTATVTVLASPDAVAVTVMARLAGLPPVVRVAFASPLVSVVAWVTWSAPELAVIVTGTPDTTLLFASLARTLMVAVVVPSDSSVALLVMTVSDLAVGLVELLLLPQFPPPLPPPSVLPQLLLPLVPPQPEIASTSEPTAARAAILIFSMNLPRCFPERAPHALSTR
jgi:hypothetical protein